MADAATSDSDKTKRSLLVTVAKDKILSGAALIAIPVATLLAAVSSHAWSARSEAYVIIGSFSFGMLLMAGMCRIVTGAIDYRHAKKA